MDGLRCVGVLDALDVHRVEAFCTCLNLELDFLTSTRVLNPSITIAEKWTNTS